MIETESVRRRMTSDPMAPRHLVPESPIGRNEPRRALLSAGVSSSKGPRIDPPRDQAPALGARKAHMRGLPHCASIHWGVASIGASARLSAGPPFCNVTRSPFSAMSWRTPRWRASRET
jgi:hypothetical protein